VELLTHTSIIDGIARALDGLEPSTSGSLTSRGAALAFDGDGTLWRGDVGEDFFHAVVEHGDLRPVAVEAMCAVGRAAGLDRMDIHDGGVAVARRVFDGYLHQRVAEDVICELIAWVCAGWREAEVKAFAAEVLVRGDLASRRHAELAAIIEWARASGRDLELFLVSASPRPIVEAAGLALGFDRAHVLAATALFSAEDVMLAEVVRPIPYGPGKATLLADRLGDRALVAAFGDNVFDVPMLQAALVPVVVEPKPRLVACLAAAETTFRVPPVRVVVG